MSTTLAVARRYIDAVAANDLAALAAMLAPDIVWHRPGSHSSPAPTAAPAPSASWSAT